MSRHDARAPVCNTSSAEAVELIIDAKSKSIGEMSVGRVLPSPMRRSVGPLVFFDHMGPAELPPGEGISVRPHPHINLATVTYLFEGEIVHRDSLGYEQTIRPGAINWMTAGKGIAHSERSGEDQHTHSKLHGIQLWVALPQEHEETEPSFVHYPADAMPEKTLNDAVVRVLIGSGWGLTSPVRTLHPMLYAQLSMKKPDQAVSIGCQYEELAVYCVSGEVNIDGVTLGAKTMAVLAPGQRPELRARKPSTLMVIGGAPLDGPRHMWWNFVSSRRERIEQAKADWKQGNFGKVKGDEQEFIPLPED